MIHQLVPWSQLIRTGIPALKVALRPLVVNEEVTVGVGQAFDPELFPERIRARRLRQFYEMRRLEPVDPQPDSQQYWRERFERLHGQKAPIIEPITPVASQIVAEDLPTVEVPVAGDEPAKRRPKGAK
jgi:hypothetical protein